ncbi:MAG TPA: 2'-deoxycytidine 5'-triphosphate deaminase, partial [Parvularculaceae bacterium]|nr:2'-deoxycytidine 5'-triphosphate deaminase [Parvularculaceae bacterium]
MSERDNEGVFSAEAIARLIGEGRLNLGVAAGPRQIQPASLDLTLGRRGWRVRASFLPSPARSVRERLEDGLLMHELDLDQGAVFERGCVYVVELAEKLSLPADVSGAANPKSSTGRIDVFVRLVADRAGAFDEVPIGYEGPLYAEISPRTFSIVARAGSSLNQLRLKRGQCRLADEELRSLHAETALIDACADIDGGLGLSVKLAGAAGETVGWRARRHAALIDVDAVGQCAAEDYFEPIAAPKSGFIILDPDEFYILASREALVIPPDYAAEMTPINPGLGEFRVHYAGFFDPGFGW